MEEKIKRAREYAKKMAELATEEMDGENPETQSVWNQIYAQALKQELCLA
jgi:hypothetical protein